MPFVSPHDEIICCRDIHKAWKCEHCDWFGHAEGHDLAGPQTGSAAAAPGQAEGHTRRPAHGKGGWGHETIVHGLRRNAEGELGRAAGHNCAEPQSGTAGRPTGGKERGGRGGAGGLAARYNPARPCVFVQKGHLEGQQDTIAQGLDLGLQAAQGC